MIYFARIISMAALYVMVSEFVLSARIVFDPSRSFATSLKNGTTPAAALINVLLLPLVVFLIVFSFRGRRGWQTRAAKVSAFVTVLGPLAYLVASLRVRLPNNYFDAALVVGAILLFFLWFGVVFGAFLRARAIAQAPLAGYCKKCAYDLRGSVSGFCTECGKPYIGPD